MWQTIIHGMFIVSAIGIAYVDKLSSDADVARGNAVKTGHGKH